MSPESREDASTRLTVNDVRHHAEEVRDLAKAEVRRISSTEPARIVAYAVVGVLVVASLAYYLGSRRCPACDAEG